MHLPKNSSKMASKVVIPFLGFLDIFKNVHVHPTMQSSILIFGPLKGHLGYQLPVAATKRSTLREETEGKLQALLGKPA